MFVCTYVHVIRPLGSQFSFSTHVGHQDWQQTLYLMSPYLPQRNCFVFLTFFLSQYFDILCFLNLFCAVLFFASDNFYSSCLLWYSLKVPCCCYLRNGNKNKPTKLFLFIALFTHLLIWLESWWVKVQRNVKPLCGSLFIGISFAAS